MKQYCPICGCEQEMILVQREETYPVKGEKIDVSATVCVCKECGEELMSVEYDDENLRKAYAKYRDVHGLLQPDEIKAIREQYGVSQVTFARIIGVGYKTIARYENGSLQDEAINNLILLARDLKNFSVLFKKNKHLLAGGEAKRIEYSLGTVKEYCAWNNSPSVYVYNCDEEIYSLIYA